MFMKNNLWIFAAYSLIAIISIFYLFRGIHSSYYVTSYTLDLTPRLVGTKNLIISGIDPYTKDGTKLIEIAYFGRELNESDLLMRQKFFYPLYIIFFYFPLAYVDMPNAVFIVYIISFILFIITTLVWTKAIIGLNKLLSATVIIYFLLSPIAYQAISTMQPFIIVFFLISISYYLLLYKPNKCSYFLAGILLFLSTIKPQSSLLAIGYIFIVLLPNMNDRRLWVSLFFGFVLMGLISLIITNALVPGWIAEYVQSLYEYRSYAETGIGADKLFGKGVISLVSWLLFGLVGLWMTIICYKTNRKSLHLICFSYLLILQGLIFPFFSYVLLMGMPIVALGMKQAILIRKKLENMKLIIIVFVIFLIFYIMMNHWLIFLSRSANYAKIINSHSVIMKIFSVGTSFVILPLMLGLGIILFILSYKNQTHNVDNPVIAKVNKR
jgi:hypothetical protein